MHRVDKTTVLPLARPFTGASSSVLRNSKHARIKNSSFMIQTTILNFNAVHIFLAFLFIFLTLVYSPVWRSIWWRDVYVNANVTNSETVNDPSLLSSMHLLHQWVAPNAISNAGGRADEARCHPGTRTEVIGLIEKFLDAREETDAPMMWLSGPAGAGKSAIMQTIAERCEERGVPHANFFFFRTDSSRSNATALVATLMHQIIQLYPSLGKTVAAALASNPLIFSMGIQQQFDTLMHLPFSSVRQSSSSDRPIVLLIDGLDECDSESKTSQWQILRALDNLLAREDVSFRVVVASRVEPYISMAFKQLRVQVESIFLDEKYSPEKDIRLFVSAEFDRIKSNHYLAHTLNVDWPSDSDLDDIVEKSSGQFIYAATVIRFMAQSSSSPVLSLQKIQRIIRPTRNLPFSHLDAIYTYILEQVEDQDTVKTILACTLVAGETDVPTLRACINVHHENSSAVMLDSCLADLTSIAQIRHGVSRHGRIHPHGVLQFFHASFADFLMDESRAGSFYVNRPVFSAALLPKIWPIVACQTEVGVAVLARLAYARTIHPTREITDIFMDPILSNSDLIELGDKAVEYLVLINRNYDLYDQHLPNEILMIWHSAIHYLVSRNTEFAENEPAFYINHWKSHMQKLDRALPENLRSQLSR